MSCHKATETGMASLSFDSLETEVVRDFAAGLVFTRYGSLLGSTVDLQDKITRLKNETSATNLTAARTGWKNMRAEWELSEGFLLGPVESNDYDPNTDTWPTDYVQMDSLLASTNPLRENDVKKLAQSLRGYHPLEYILWGKGGTRTAAQLTVRQKQYMVSLIADLLNNNVQALYNDWFLGADNFQKQVLTAGKGSNTFSSRQALFLNIVSAMSDICGEVGSSKMLEPFIARDSAITESPYSSNTLIDFRNNILGLQQVYMGLDGNKGIRNLVAAKNLQLDQKIQIQMNAAVSSFNLITARYEEAIFTQRPQIVQTMDQLAALNELLETDLKNFIIQYIKD
jgi:putative iron-regulated protein